MNWVKSQIIIKEHLSKKREKWKEISANEKFNFTIKEKKTNACDTFTS